MKRLSCLHAVATGLLLFFASAASAQASQHFIQQTTAALPQTTTVDTANEPTPLNDKELADYRGGQAIMIANQTLSSIVSDPSIGGNVSGGAVSLTDNALSNFNGLGNLVINTGSQVSLQSGMNVIINVHQ